MGDGGDASPAVSYAVDVVEDPDIGPESTFDDGGRGNESLGGFAALADMFLFNGSGVMGLKVGGGGKAMPDSGEDV